MITTWAWAVDTFHAAWSCWFFVAAASNGIYPSLPAHSRLRKTIESFHAQRNIMLLAQAYSHVIFGLNCPLTLLTDTITPSLLIVPSALLAAAAVLECRPNWLVRVFKVEPYTMFLAKKGLLKLGFLIEVVFILRASYYSEWFNRLQLRLVHF